MFHQCQKEIALRTLVLIFLCSSNLPFTAVNNTIFRCLSKTKFSTKKIRNEVLHAVCITIEDEIFLKFHDNIKEGYALSLGIDTWKNVQSKNVLGGTLCGPEDTYCSGVPFYGSTAVDYAIAEAVEKMLLRYQLEGLFVQSLG